MNLTLESVTDARPAGTPAVRSGTLLASPHRVQLSRKKGWKMPPNTVSVARPSKWGNPVKVGDWFNGRQITCADAVKWYEQHITPDSLMGQDAVRELRGKNLGCFCKLTEKCHADVLLKLANGAAHRQPPTTNKDSNAK